MIDSLKPGQNVRCTLTKMPRAEAARKTVLRLMRSDPAAIKALRRAHMLRMRNMVVYNRGNRDWFQRRPSAKVVTLKTGNTWTFVYSAQIAPDLASVSDCLKIEKA